MTTRHEQPIVVRTAKAEVGATLGQADVASPGGSWCYRPPTAPLKPGCAWRCRSPDPSPRNARSHAGAALSPAAAQTGTRLTKKNDLEEHWSNMQYAMGRTGAKDGRKFAFVVGGIGTMQIPATIKICEALGKPWRLFHCTRHCQRTAFHEVWRSLRMTAAFAPLHHCQRAQRVDGAARRVEKANARDLTARADRAKRLRHGPPGASV